MDIKVYKKEEVSQPSGMDYVFVPDIIDLVPVITEDSEGNEILANAVILDENSKELVEQECTIATIKQKGLDPLDLEDGIKWSEALLGEVNTIELMQDISDSVTQVTNSLMVTFDTVTDADGHSFLSYRLQEVV